MYREAGLSIQHPSYSDRSSVAHQKAYANIQTEHVNFNVFLQATDGVVAPEILQTAEDVLSRIVELDAAMTSRMTGDSYEEYLAFIDILHDEIELHYYANAVNTEWGAFFVRDEHGDITFDTFG